MTSANILAARRAIESFNARDVEAYTADFDPKVDFHARFAALGEVTIYHGHDGVRSWLEDFDEAWSELRIEPEAFFDLGDRVLTFYEQRGRGQKSGVETSMWFSSVGTWRDGLCVSLKFYRDKEEAFAELGVTEDDLEPIAP